VKSTTPKLKIGTVRTLALSPDGKLLAKVQTHVTVWDVATGEQLAKTRPMSHCSRIAWSPDSKQLAVTNTCNHSVVLNPVNGTVIRDLENAAPLGEDGADPHFSSCGKFLVTGRWDGSLLVYDLESGRLKYSESWPHEMITAIFPVNGGKKRLVLHSPKTLKGENFSPPDYLTLHTWPFTPGKSKRIDLPIKHSLVSFAISGDGKFAAFDLFRSFQVLSLPDAKLIHEEAAEMPLSNPLQWSTDGKWLAVALKNNAVNFYKTGDFKRKITYPIERPRCVSFSPRGDCVAFGCETKASRLVPWTEVFGEA
jgi:WD40 repeat protein